MHLLCLLNYMLSGKTAEQWSVSENEWDGNRKNVMGQCEENNVFASKLLYCNLNYMKIRK